MCWVEVAVFDDAIEEAGEVFDVVHGLSFLLQCEIEKPPRLRHPSRGGELFKQIWACVNFVEFKYFIYVFAGVVDDAADFGVW